MRLTSITLGLALATLVATAAAAQKITTESNPGTNFASYKTFTWLKQPNVGDPLLKQRIVDDINTQLQAKGLQPAQEGGDLAVAAHVATKTEKSLNTFYDGFGGGWRWGGGFGSATTMVNTYQEGTLVVDLFDTKTKEAVWRGTATQRVSRTHRIRQRTSIRPHRKSSKSSRPLNEIPTRSGRRLRRASPFGGRRSTNTEDTKARPVPFVSFVSLSNRTSRPCSSRSMS